MRTLTRIIIALAALASVSACVVRTDDGGWGDRDHAHFDHDYYGYR